MPRPIKRSEPNLTDGTFDVERFEKARRDFAESFERSAKGNLWRTWDGMTVTVFKRKDDRWAWCITDDRTRRFSPGGYDDEHYAISALATELGVGNSYLPPAIVEPW